MKRYDVLIAGALALFLGLGCRGKDYGKCEAIPTRWTFEGWACTPDQDKKRQGEFIVHYCRHSSNRDYLYLKFEASASKQAMDSGLQGRMELSCRESAKQRFQEYDLTKIVGEYLDKSYGISEGSEAVAALVLERARSGIKEKGIYDCCSIDKDTAACTQEGKREDWSQCMCVGYLKFPGGRKIFDHLIHNADETSAEEAPAREQKRVKKQK